MFCLRFSWFLGEAHTEEDRIGCSEKTSAAKVEGTELSKQSKSVLARNGSNGLRFVVW